MKNHNNNKSRKYLKEKENNDRPFNFWLYFLFIVVFDQSIKQYIQSSFVSGSSKSIIKSIISLTYVTNTGVSFGMLKGMNLLFIIISFIALGLFSYIYLKNRRYSTQLAIICGGIAGNLIDRLNYGYVIDFIDFHIWPIFNIADFAINFGIFWLIFLLIRNKDDLSLELE